MFFYVFPCHYDGVKAFEDLLNPCHYDGVKAFEDLLNQRCILYNSYILYM